MNEGELMFVLGAALVVLGIVMMVATDYIVIGMIVTILSVAPMYFGSELNKSIDAEAQVTIISGPFATALPCMDGGNGLDCLTHDERVDRARMIAEGLKEAGGADKLRDMLCASSLTMLICVEVTPKTNLEIIE